MKFELQLQNVEIYMGNGNHEENFFNELESLNGLAYEYSCESSSNNYQFDSSFDHELLSYFISRGHSPIDLDIKKSGLDVDYDFCLNIQGGKVAFEIEKANKEKILYDFLKFHVYLSCGMDLAVLFVPKNWVHARGEYDLFDIAKKRLKLCIDYKMGHYDYLQRIVIAGFDQFYDGKRLSRHMLLNMKKKAQENLKRI